jgi:hypothetical protein
MPFIRLPPLGGIRGGDMCYSLIGKLLKRGEAHAPDLELINILSVKNHKRKQFKHHSVFPLRQPSLLYKMGTLQQISV